MPQYTPLALANTFLQRHGSGGIEHMKLQKLAYYAYGWWLAYEAEPLLVEGPELWKFGPVFSSLYRVLAPFGSRPIADPQKASPFSDPTIIPDGDGKTLGLVDWIWERYGGLGSFTLSDMTHAPGTPWQIEAEKNQYRVPQHYKIPDPVIADYFKREAAKLQAA